MHGSMRLSNNSTSPPFSTCRCCTQQEYSRERIPPIFTVLVLYVTSRMSMGRWTKGPHKITQVRVTKRRGRERKEVAGRQFIAFLLASRKSRGKRKGQSRPSNTGRHRTLQKQEMPRRNTNQHRAATTAHSTTQNEQGTQRPPATDTKW
jgi:hypothetical protein